MSLLNDINKCKYIIKKVVIMIEFITSVVICFLLYHIVRYLPLEIGISRLADLICIIVPICFFFVWITEDKKQNILHSNPNVDRIIDATNTVKSKDKNSAINDAEESSDYNYQEPSINYNQTPSYQQIERTPIRNACRACKQTGRCGVCNGSGQQISAVSLVTEETVYMDCRTCGGRGICHACGGDGYLDEGIDF